MSKPTDLVQGTLDLLILKIIALEPMHGWAIAQRIRQMSNDVLQVGRGALANVFEYTHEVSEISCSLSVVRKDSRANLS